MKIFSMFDGVGGFIVGLENSSKEIFKTLYSNQYEPSRKIQDAYEVGLYRFPNMEHIGTDVALIPNEKFEEMRKNGVDMIVGGFPCQDYSVARSKKNELGIEGKKGVLFWEIIRATEVIKPKYLILENVDRLLKAPSSQRGRDFAVMLAAFNELGYSVEWRVINAADYGRAQRRRRVFFFVFRNDTKWGERLHKTYESNLPKKATTEERLAQYQNYIFADGLFGRQFPVKDMAVKKRINANHLIGDIAEVSETFNDGKFWNSGLMTNGYYYTIETDPIVENPITMGDIVVPEDTVDAKYYITGEKLEKFKYLRGPKKITRTSADGHEYTYAEGGMSEYDSLELPGRTMLTSEGSVNRSTHLLKINGNYRLITPIEAERLQDFPDDWTKFKLNAKGEVEEVSDRMRMFFMGNALVTGIVKRIGDELQKIDKM
ncbi:cytosine-specific methyltransferase [Veillonella tobetsuensis]|mgnify:FL=1|uniref:Cytosine-specific methyltransferase n=2 Tax=Veillonella tobetsuensis TaxID=1110546 RepID=A0A480B7T8_9FIRM|nr:cytosine-specific methyltransferase [Veillonella tobetsuensis]